MKDTIHIDGSIGGGSVLRVAVPLALSLDRNIEITNIRAKRKTPGLRTQHLIGLQLLAEISNYQLLGGEVGSTNISLKKSEETKIEKECYRIDIGTAASISLIIQALSNYAFGSKSSVKVEFEGGGTHTNWAPNIDYVRYVTTPLFSKFGQKIEINLIRHGFFPIGGSSGSFKITQEKWDQVQLSPELIKEVDIYCVVSHQLKRARVAERQIKQMGEMRTHASYVDSPSPGSSLTAVMRSENSIRAVSQLGKRGLRAEKIGKDISDQIKAESEIKISVDNFMADQLLVPLAFSPSGSYFTYREDTPHIKSNIVIIEKIMGRIFEKESHNTYIKIIKV